MYPDDVQHEPSITVEYDILLSQTYCVPVLYFLVVKGLSTTLLDIDFIYQHLVPESQVPELQHVGVMGGITMTVGFEDMGLHLMSLLTVCRIIQ